MAKGGHGDYEHLFAILIMIIAYPIDLAAFVIPGTALFCVGRRDFDNGLFIAGIVLMAIGGVAALVIYMLVFFLDRKEAKECYSWLTLVLVLLLIIGPGVGCGIGYKMLPPS